MTPIASHHRRILVVDDEADVRDYLGALLADAGYEVQAAESGPAAWQAVSERPPDLLCLDVMMPENSGLWLFQRMRGTPQTHGIPIMILSGMRPDHELRAWFSRGDNGGGEAPPEAWIDKPIVREPFLRRVEQLLADNREVQPTEEHR